MIEDTRSIEVVDNAEDQRYDLLVDGELAGTIVYRDPRAGVRQLVHTEVRPELSGQGLASIIARAALDDARAKGLKVVPTCPYVASYVQKHTEYADLVVER
ncbi:MULTISPECIES: GNAT family N-acetyltransferase [Mumia]|uniref:GNAT family N-acetyltransferase n=1 Tax=Mumia TaxID=1546255 RepID=UPI0014219501|nr:MULTISPECIES: GNAT family N-acetyltransferase [unclassified Mumia]QMW66026.1 N-acetyltransferase [Mumia sp. ZJ1417]